MRSFSYGGGVQSTAALVLAAQGRIDFQTFLFCNVGDRAENPETIAYFAEHAMPFAEAHGLKLTQLRWVDRSGRERDLYDDLLAAKRDIAIPMRLGSGAFGNRKCTSRYKIEVVARHLRRAGATPDDPAVVGIGISTDEFERAKPGVPKEQPWTTRAYPLLDLGLSRSDCQRIVADAGLPPVPKSACWFCPFQNAHRWRERDAVTIELGQRLEDTLNERRAMLGRDPAGLLSPTLRLTDAIEYQAELDLDGPDCDSGYCFT